MLIPLEDVIRKHAVRRGSVLHIGAHMGEEAGDYVRFGFMPVWWVEGNPELFAPLSLRLAPYQDHHVVSALLAESERDVVLHIANNGQSSSILPLGTHATEHPEVHYVRDVPRRTTTVDALWDKGKIGQADFMNIDVQGAELSVLRGAGKYLGGVSAVYTEVNERELYEGCVLLPELNAFLQHHGFQMVDMVMTNHGWGDGLWLRD